jgi:hypothetical protein
LAPRKIRSQEQSAERALRYEVLFGGRCCLMHSGSRPNRFRGSRLANAHENNKLASKSKAGKAAP